jgi:hypothetical protein
MPPSWSQAAGGTTVKKLIKKYGAGPPVVIEFEPSPINPAQLLRITRVSDITGKVNTRDLPVTEDQLRNWLEGHVLIQHAMPHLSDEQREFLISGVTPEEWHKHIKGRSK